MSGSLSPCEKEVILVRRTGLPLLEISPITLRRDESQKDFLCCEKEFVEMAKAIQITDEVYAELVGAKELAVQEAKRMGRDDLVQALVAMGIGAFSGWLIFNAIKELSRSSGAPTSAPPSR